MSRARVLVALALAAAPGCRRLSHRRNHAPIVQASVSSLAAPRLAPHAYGRRGDLVLHTPAGPALTVAATEDLPGHRPMRGAVVDVLPRNEDRADPLLWWRPAWIDAEHRAHALVAREVRAARCANGTMGVRVEGEVDGVALEHTLCAVSSGRFVAHTRALRALPEGATLGDELAPGTADAATDLDGTAWTERSEGTALAIAEKGTALSLTRVDRGAASEAGAAPALVVHRRLIRIAAEVFRDAIRVEYPGARAQVSRALTVRDGDLLDAFAHAGVATRAVRVRVRDRRGAYVSLEDGARGERFSVRVSPGETQSERVLQIPLRFTGQLVARDADGVQAGTLALEADAPRERTWELAEPPRAALDLEFGEEGGLIPVHVIIRGFDGTPDPVLRSIDAEGRAREGVFTAANSAYLTRGAARLVVAPGRYTITATHGPLYTRFRESLTINPGQTVRFVGLLRRVVPAEGYTSADLHLHAEPSPDSRVSLAERVASLACEGVGMVVAKDHNRVTDYAPAVEALRLGGRITVLAGNEITTGGRALFGHFNGFPWRASSESAGRAPEERVSAYFNLDPRAVFAAAREAGADVLQVNHPRMPPAIGYFDQVRFDARTGIADVRFSTDFDAVEAFNGMWLETPARVREGARDLVGLARRGVHVAATGNSDSHHLLFEEPGWPRTYLRLDRATVMTAPGQALADAIRRQETTVSAGPFVELWVDDRGPGSTVTARQRRVHVRVRVSAPAWIDVSRVELWTDDRAEVLPVTLSAVDGVRGEYEADVPVTRDVVMLAWAEGERGLEDALPYANARPIGFTSLVYVDADGDGAVRIEPGAPSEAADVRATAP